MRPLLIAALAAAAVVVVPAGSTSAAAPPAEQVTTYTPVAPTRVLDTRATRPVGPGGTVTLDLAGRVPAGTLSVVLNVTGVAPSAATYVTVFPGGQRPGVSSLNLRAGETRANLVTVTVSAARTVSLHNNAGSTHLVADLAGYYARGTGGSRYTPLEPSRVAGPHLGPRGTATVDLAGRVPVSATAVVLTVTGTRGTSETYLTAYPAGTVRPTASTVNLARGATTPNQVTVALGAGRRVEVFNLAGDVDVLVDLAGFYTPEFGAAFVPVAPTRVFDTRSGLGTDFGVAGPIGPGHSDGFAPGERLPADAIAASLNLTGIAPTASTFVSAWSSLTLPPPGTSNLNLTAGQTAASHAVVPLTGTPAGARSGFYNHAGQVHVAADLAGYFWVPPTDCVTGCVHAWGRDGGVLGTGRTNPATPSPTPVGLSGVVDVDDGYAVRADGTVWAWGGNFHAELGNGWASTVLPVTTPVRVRGLSEVTQVASAGVAGIALRADGTVWAWGRNQSGLLGTGGGDDPTAPPVQVAGLTEVTEIAATTNAGYAIRADGTLWAWGYNGGGLLGDGSTVTESATPVRVGRLTGVTDVDADGFTTYAHTSDGAVWAWGSNEHGELGDGSDVELSRVPVRFTRLPDAVDLSVDFWGRGFAVRADGTVWGWGTNREGELGTGEYCEPQGTAPECFAEEPVRVANLTGIVDVELTALGGRALAADGRVWTWGGNRDGDLGQGTTGGHSTVPVQVPGIGPASELGGGGALVPEVGGA